MWEGDGGYDDQRPGPSRAAATASGCSRTAGASSDRDSRVSAPARASQRSMSVRAMLIPGGIIGRSSARYHCASTISVSSMTMSPPAHVGLEPDHQRVRERPRLAGDVAHVGDRHADLLAHLAVHGLLHRLARLDEAGDAAVHRHRERAAASEQRLAVALDERDHRRRQAREGEQPARRDSAAPAPRPSARSACRTDRRTAWCGPSRRAARPDRRASSARRRPGRRAPSAAAARRARRRRRRRRPRRRRGRSPSRRRRRGCRARGAARRARRRRGARRAPRTWPSRTTTVIAPDQSSGSSSAGTKRAGSPSWRTAGESRAADHVRSLRGRPVSLGILVRAEDDHHSDQPRHDL